MPVALKLAYRNLFRAKKRLALNLVLLVGAFSAIVIFLGFRTYVLNIMQYVMVETQFGHVEVAKKDYWDNKPVDQALDRMLLEPQPLIDKISALPTVAKVTGRVRFFGMLNTETQSLPALFIGFDPKVEDTMQSHLRFTEGKELTSAQTVIISSGLQKLLKVPLNGDVTAVAPALNGSFNARDFKVSGVFKTGIAEMDKALVYMPMSDVQQILDSNAIDQLMIIAKNSDQVARTAREITTTLNDPDLVTKPWTDVADLYMQTENFYKFQNLIIEIIMILLLVLSVSNTMNMVIFERSAEIGTLRAIGDSEDNIRALFLMEAVCLGLLAIVIAIPFSAVMVFIISHLGIEIDLPMSSLPMPVLVTPVFAAYVEAAAICLVSVVLASLWPIHRGVKTQIVTLLRAKI